jgi:hypothetical protein
MYDISLIAKFRCLGFDAWRFEGEGTCILLPIATPLNSLVPEPKIHLKLTFFTAGISSLF